jgi:hypothetical protein
LRSTARHKLRQIAHSHVMTSIVPNTACVEIHECGGTPITICKTYGLSLRLRFAL